MAPAHSRKRKSDEIEEPVAVTPTGSPRKKMRITQSQKQALMDNLQLEITERARQLRAGYALQCADLRARLERRVNRIPLSIRKMTMAALAEQHETAKPSQKNTQATSYKQISVEVGASHERPLPPPPRQDAGKMPSPARPQAPAAATRGRKRKSSDMRIASDKENDATGAADTLPVAKNSKRAKAAAPTRTASRTAKPISVLSPRSHNSRTLPRSPVKEHVFAPLSPAKSMIARPTSPLKPASPLKSAASAATSAISASMHGMIEHAKRSTAAKLNRTASKEKSTTTTSTRGQMLPPPRPVSAAPLSPQRTTSQTSTHSSSTDSSTSSNGTTVVKPKRGRAAAASKADVAGAGAGASTAKRGVAAKAASAAKTALKRNATTAASKKVVVAEPAAGRRVLRKRT